MAFFVSTLLLAKHSPKSIHTIPGMLQWCKCCWFTGRMSLGPLHDHPCCERHEPSRIKLWHHDRCAAGAYQADNMLYSNFFPSAMRSPSSHWFCDLPLSALLSWSETCSQCAYLTKDDLRKKCKPPRWFKRNKLTYKYRIMYIYIYIIWPYIGRWCLQLRNQWINDAPEPHGAGPGPSVEPDADGGSNR